MMCLEIGRKANVGLLPILVILVFSSGCTKKMRGPLTIEEISNVDVRLPVYYLDSDSIIGHEEIGVTYYYYNYQPEFHLVTYFSTENSEGEKSRVARMSTYNLNGQLVSTDETKGLPSKPIVWSKTGGGACKVLPRAYDNERITGDPYQSCLFWMDKNLNQYKLYTVWNEEEAVNFANSLVMLDE